MWDNEVPEIFKEIQRDYPSPDRHSYVLLNKGAVLTAIPLKKFIKRPNIYSSVFNVNTIDVVSARGRILDLSTMTEERMHSLLNRLGVRDIENTLQFIKKRHVLMNDRSIYGKVFYLVLNRKISNGEVRNSRINSNEFRQRMEHLRVDIITESRGISSIINEETPYVTIISNKINIELIKSYETGQDEEKPLDTYMSDIAHRIAEESLMSELNTDDPFEEGNDHYYWTYDGMQIRITSINNTSDAIPNFIFDIETPYGVLYHMTTDETTDEIVSEISDKYKLMTTPLPHWRPLDRDVFLNNKQMEYKDNSQKVIDIIQEVQKYYPEMRDYGKRYKINLKPLQNFSDIDKSFLSGIIDAFSTQHSAKEFVKRISNDGEITSKKELEQYFPRKRLPVNSDYSDIQKMALIYDIASKNNPNTYGWRVFHRVK